MKPDEFIDAHRALLDLAKAADAIDVDDFLRTLYGLPPQVLEAMDLDANATHLLAMLAVSAHRFRADVRKIAARMETARRLVKERT